MRGVLWYIAAYYRRRAFASVRTVLGLTVALTVLVYMAALWPATHFSATAPARHAEFAVRVNGPLTTADRVRLRAIVEATGSKATECNSCDAGGWLVRGDRLTAIGSSVTYYDGEGLGSGYRTMFSRGMLAKGDLMRADAVGIDVLTAKRLGVHLGERVTVEQVFVANDGTNVRTRARGTVSALFTPASGVRGLLVPAGPEMARCLASISDVILNDVYMVNAEGEKPILAAIESTEVPRNWGVVTRTAARAQAEATARGSVGEGLRSTGVWVGALVFLVYLVREQATRLARRRKSYAVLHSLGAPLRTLVWCSAAEQLLLTAFVAAAGTTLGLGALTSDAGLLLPRTGMLGVASLMAAMTAAVVGLGVLFIRARVRRMPVARLLASE